MDRLTPDQRSALMAKVKGRNTKPELKVRSLLHSMGYRFRLHRKDLPGTPDIVLPKHKKCIFVHGCFWHQHEGCRRASLPATNAEFWRSKLLKNKERDRLNMEKLDQLGWGVCVIWECQAINDNKLRDAINQCFSS